MTERTNGVGPGATDRYIVTAANSEKDTGHVIKIANRCGQPSKSHAGVSVISSSKISE